MFSPWPKLTRTGVWITWYISNNKTKLSLKPGVEYVFVQTLVQTFERRDPERYSTINNY
jgi:hypothetical protein